MSIFNIFWKSVIPAIVVMAVLGAVTIIAGLIALMTCGISTSCGNFLGYAVSWVGYFCFFPALISDKLNVHVIDNSFKSQLMVEYLYCYLLTSSWFMGRYFLEKRRSRTS
jgi:hypothetical protein